MKQAFVRIGRKRLAMIMFAVLTLAFFYLLYLPVDHFDEGQSMCMSVILFGKECYACGMTRGIHHLLHADFTGAWGYNKLSFIVMPLAIYMIASSLYKMSKEKEEEV